MYKRILTVVNKDSFSVTAANYALHLAKYCDANLLIFSCMPSKFNKDTLLRIESHVNSVFLQAIKMGIKVESVIEEEPYFIKLKEKIEKEYIDLVFATIHKENNNELSNFARNIPVSLALVRIVSMAKPHPTNILLPLKDKINNIDELVEFVSAMCKSFHSKATIFHIEKTNLIGNEMRFRLTDFHENLSKDIVDVLKKLASQGIVTRKRVWHGKVGTGITIEAASSKRNDLIIMGISKNWAIKKFFTEDPTTFVIKQTPCNLIIFKAKNSNEVTHNKC